MRLWSISPSFLDRMGLLGLWREALQAQRIIIGDPPYKGPYANHPQLERFKNHEDPVKAITYYLKQVHSEGLRRGYDFKRDLIKNTVDIYTSAIWIPRGQVNYEIRLLLHKLDSRDKAKKMEVIRALEGLEPWEGFPPIRSRWNETNPLFTVDSTILTPATWERVKEF